jgi:hypothetical protein
LLRLACNRAGKSVDRTGEALLPQAFPQPVCGVARHVGSIRLRIRDNGPAMAGHLVLIPNFVEHWRRGRGSKSRNLVRILLLPLNNAA